MPGLKLPSKTKLSSKRLAKKKETSNIVLLRKLNSGKNDSPTKLAKSDEDRTENS